jgi:hypothetical protein
MKKIFFIVIGLYLSVSGIIILIKDKDYIDSIEILSIKKDYARIITDNEPIDIPVYISSENSFFTSSDNIVDARILSDFDEVEIKISQIKNQKQVVTYNNKQYYLYYYEIDLNNVYTLGLKLDFINANISLTYNNDETLNLEIGDLSLLFHEITGSNHLDYSRMYSVHDQDAIIGIYIEMINKTGQEITIKSIDVLNNNMFLNLNKAKIVYEPLNHLQPIDEIIPGFQNLVTEFPNPQDFSFKHNNAIFIPINYLNTFNYINRFPLMISYEYNNTIYDYIIDDYLFYSQISDLYNGLFEIQTYQYHY